MPPAIGYAIAGIAAGAGMFGAAKVQSKAAKQTAQIQATAATDAGEREETARREAEQLARQNAQQVWQDAETARKANYDQWAARQRAMNAFRKQYGYTEMGVPEYVASQDPGFYRPPADAAAAPGAPPEDYEGPAADSWRTRPVRPTGQPMGPVESYLPQGPGYQPYTAPGSVGDLLQPRRRRAY